MQKVIKKKIKCLLNRNIEYCSLNYFNANMNNSFNYNLLFKSLRSNSHFDLLGDESNLVIRRNADFVNIAFAAWRNRWKERIIMLLLERFPLHFFDHRFSADISKSDRFRAT